MSPTNKTSRNGRQPKSALTPNQNPIKTKGYDYVIKQ